MNKEMVSRVREYCIREKINIDFSRLNNLELEVISGYIDEIKSRTLALEIAEQRVRGLKSGLKQYIKEL